MTTEKVQGVCPHDCPDSCAVVTEVREGRAVRFYAAAEHPVTQGWLCAKIRPYLDHVYHPGRLLRPLRRTGPKGSGQWQEISWVEALDEIGSRWREIIDEFGAEAILPYSFSGTLGVVQMEVTNTRFWNRLGASRLQRSICGAAAAMAINATLGAKQSPAYEDVQHSKLVIVWGHNPISTAPHFTPFLKMAQRNGCQLIVIDPRRTRTAKGADWHIMPKPGSDGALALGIAHILVREGLHDELWLADHALGWPQLRRRLEEYPPERVAEICGLDPLEIHKLTRLYADNQPGLIKIADGLQRNFNGGQTVRAICTLPALTGQYGMRGGGLAYTTSGYISWNPEAMNHWADCPPPGRSVNMNRLGAALLGEVDDPPIKSLFVYGSNPAAIAPNAGLVMKGLQRDDLFTVVHELFLTDTADYADIVLPATSQLEQTDLHKAYGHTVLAYNRQAIPPMGEAKSNWEVMGLLSQEMEFDDSWLHQSVDEVIEELLLTTADDIPALTGVTLKRLQQEGFIRLKFEPSVPFADGQFPTKSGKIELYSQFLADQGIDPLPDWKDVQDNSNEISHSDNGRFSPAEALDLITAAAHHFVSSSLANQPGLLKREGEPFVEIHPRDAEARDIRDGDMVIVENGRGWCELRAVITDGVRPGVLASPKGRWQKLSGGRNVNWTTSDALGDMAGQSTFHSNQVWLRKQPVETRPLGKRQSMSR
ncbi:MAG: molybdopterin oxidoreductase family protein [Candidatus Promineifilaceae bacterium]|nr:molybdopterin oxidoreductase family protein [Candidatus Promineifilaceae bacterium]